MSHLWRSCTPLRPFEELLEGSVGAVRSSGRDAPVASCVTTATQSTAVLCARINPHGPPLSVCRTAKATFIPTGKSALAAQKTLILKR